MQVYSCVSNADEGIAQSLAVLNAPSSIMCGDLSVPV